MLPSQQAEAAGHLPDRRVFPVAQRFEVDLGPAEADAPLAGLVGLADQPSDVQQRLRGDATVVQADAARVRRGVDQRHIEAALGGEEGGGVTARAGAQHR